MNAFSSDKRYPTSMAFWHQADWHTNVPPFQDLRPDHVRVESPGCCFPRELVRFVHPRELVSFDSWHVTRSPPIGKRIWVGRYNNTIYIRDNKKASPLSAVAWLDHAIMPKVTYGFFILFSQIENEADQDSRDYGNETPHHHLPKSSPKYITKREDTFTSAGGELSARAPLHSNVRIIVPKGAIPAGVKQPVFFGVFFDETPLLQDILEASDKTLISPVVECGPHDINLQKPVEIIVPHCLCLSEAKKEWIIVYRCGNFSTEIEGNGNLLFWHWVCPSLIKHERGNASHKYHHL